MGQKRLVEKKTCAMIIKQGCILKCIRGKIWLTADNQDIILKHGGEHVFEKKSQKAVAISLSSESVIEITEKALFLEQLSLFNNKLRFSGSLPG